MIKGNKKTNRKVSEIKSVKGLKPDTFMIAEMKGKKIMGRKENNKGMGIFENTEEAIEFGEKAKLEEMKVLFEKLAKVFMEEMIFLNFNIQMVGEAIHAYKKDEWYMLNKKVPKNRG